MSDLQGGESPEQLSGPDLDDAVEAERAALEALLSQRGVSLGDPEIWSEPLDGEPELIAAIATSPEFGGHARVPGRAWMVTAMAAVAALVVAIGIIATMNREPEADWSVDLAATEAAPSATATVLGWNGDAGTRLALTVDGLEPAPDGYVYELWFSNKDRHISAGTFAQATDLEMLVGIRRGDFPRIWITLEPLDADPGPALTVLDTGPGSGV